MRTSTPLDDAERLLLSADTELRDATEALIDHANDGWPITPAEVHAAQARWDEAVERLKAAAIYRYQRAGGRPLEGGEGA